MLLLLQTVFVKFVILGNFFIVYHSFCMVEMLKGNALSMVQRKVIDSLFVQNAVNDN